MTLDMITDEIAGRILQETQDRREEIVGLCADLVAARSVNPVGDTRQAADVVCGFLRSRGITATTEWQAELMPSAIAELDSGRPGPHLILNVHLDTMPPGEETDWTVPVWELTRTDGRLYGLGMGNMKGAVAAMLHAVDLLHRMRHLWRGRVTFTAVSDEVVFGDNGAAYLLRQHPELTGDGLICGEGPGFRRLAIGEKGVLWLEITASGAAGHASSVVRGRSASARLARAVVAIDELTGLRGTLTPELATLAAEDADSGLSLTANIGTINAGTFIGQVATTGSAEVDLRLPPGVSADAAQSLVAEAVGASAPDGGLNVRRIKGWDANVTSPRSGLVGSWSRAAAAAGLEDPPHAVRLPASDASRWRQRGVPAICYGPQPTYSAGVDDYAEEDEVLNCVVLYTLAALDFLSTSESKKG